MYCSKCGAMLNEEDVFCKKCGEKVVSDICNNQDSQSSVGSISRGKRLKMLTLGLIAVIVIIAIVVALIVTFPISKKHNIILKDLDGIVVDGTVLVSDIEDVFGKSESNGETFLYYGKESAITFYEIPSDSALCYYSGELAGEFAFRFHEEYSNEVEDVIRSKCRFTTNLYTYHKYFYGDAEITTSSDYTYVRIDFSN